LVRGQQQQANKSALASQRQPTTLSLCILVAASGRPNNHVPTVNSPVPLLLQLSICQLSPGSPLMTSVDIDFVQSGDQGMHTILLYLVL